MLKKLRQEKSLTQVQVAEKANISERYYQSLEAGTSKPSVLIAQRIAKILNTNVENLFPLSTEEKHNLTT